MRPMTGSTGSTTRSRLLVSAAASTPGLRRRKASITRSAFRVDRPMDRYVRQYEGFMRSPSYPHGWDLVAWTDDGHAAARVVDRLFT